MELGLAEKVVLVTGGTRGIGLATARAFAAEGARVAITYHNEESAGVDVTGELGADAGRSLAVHYSLDEPNSADRAIAAVVERWERVDVLVTSAVRRQRRRPPGTRFEDVPAAEWEPALAANLAGTIRLAQLAVAGMRTRGWGRLALISSHVVHNGQAGQEFYAAGKAALHGLVRSLAWDAGRSGVLANVVSPGLTATDGVLAALPAELREREAALSPTGRLSSPKDVANAIVFLCSAANGNITGSALTVSGGR